MYTIEITKKLQDEFYDQFFDHINEQVREFWMNDTGPRGRTLEEAAMEIVTATEGYTMQQMLDDEAALDADVYMMMYMELVNEVTTKMLRKMSEEY